MVQFPKAAEPLIVAFASCFTRPTFARFWLLLLGDILSMGRRSVSRTLWTVRAQASGHFSSYHRFFSKATFNHWRLARVLMRLVLLLVKPDQPVVLAADDTVVRRSGRRVFARGIYRDPLRSTRAHAKVTFGHRWLVLAVVVQLPLVGRCWALPVMAMLWTSQRVDCKLARRHRTHVQLLKIMLRKLMRWHPDCSFILVGDGGIARHELAGFAWEHRRRLRLVGRMRRDTRLYNAPARRLGSGRIPKKGRKLPRPDQTVAATTPQHATVQWYGAAPREISYVSDTGIWCSYRSRRRPMVSIRWTAVIDSQTGATDYFFISDPAAAPLEVVQLYQQRWPIEVTFQESRAWLGLETTREWCRRSVQRVVPLQLGLFTLVSLIWAALLAGKHPQPLQTPCYRKPHATFADALYEVRRQIWESFLSHPQKQRRDRTKQTPHWQQILNHLAAAA